MWSEVVYHWKRLELIYINMVSHLQRCGDSWTDIWLLINSEVVSHSQRCHGTITEMLWLFDRYVVVNWQIFCGSLRVIWWLINKLVVTHLQRWLGSFTEIFMINWQICGGSHWQIFCGSLTVIWWLTTNLCWLAERGVITQSPEIQSVSTVMWWLIFISMVSHLCCCMAHWQGCIGLLTNRCWIFCRWPGQFTIK
jgi:hypothetical protein